MTLGRTRGLPVSDDYCPPVGAPPRGPPRRSGVGFGSGLRGSLFAHRGVVEERCQDGGGLHQVAARDVIVYIHIRMVGTGAVLHRILNELEAGNPHSIEREVIGVAGGTEMESAFAARSAKGASQAEKIGRTISLPCR
jgi:hypothetical protein